MEFLNLSQIELNKAGYLVSTVTSKPVTHAAFVEQQAKADYIVRLAEAVKGKTFKASKVDNLETVKAEVRAAMANTAREYVKTPKAPTSKVNDELVQFALDFDKYNDQKGRVETINKFMQQFNSINDVETVGEYFSEGVVRTTLHDTATIQKAVTSLVEVLGEI